MNVTAIPVYLQAYAVDERRWRELVESRGAREVYRELTVHPKE